MWRVNMPVSTPLGDGVLQGRFEVRDGSGSSVSDAMMVRLPINNATRRQLHASNCLTPRAEGSGLWVFSASDCQ